MKRFVRLALLICTLFGLLGHGIAVAMSPSCSAAMMQSANADTAKHMAMGKMDCCPDGATGNHGSKHSKGNMPNCPMQNCSMMSGNLGLFALNSAPVLPAVMPPKPALFTWSIASQLVGRSTAPEPPPPTI